QRTAWFYMMRHAVDCSLEPFERPNDTDRAEQTGNDVVGAPYIEIHQIGMSKVARRVLQSGGPKIVLVDVDAINLIVVPEKSRVPARTARNVEYRACAGHELTDQTAEPITFTRIILKAIDRVIKLCTFDEYAVTQHAFIRCRVQDGMQNSGPIAPRNASSP